MSFIIATFFLNIDGSDYRGNYNGVHLRGVVRQDASGIRVVVLWHVEQVSLHRRSWKKMGSGEWSNGQLDWIDEDEKSPTAAALLDRVKEKIPCW